MTASAEELFLNALSWISVCAVCGVVIYLIFKRSVPLVALRAMFREVRCLLFGKTSTPERKPTPASEIPTRLDEYALFVRDCFVEPAPPEEPIILKEHDTPDLPANGGYYEAGGRYVLRTKTRAASPDEKVTETPNALGSP